MKNAFYFLLVIFTLQLSLDETLSHFDLNGQVDLQGTSAFASVNFHLQKCHDHLWVVSSTSDVVICIVQPSVQFILPIHFLNPDYSFSFWQPPKYNLI
jgi:hypothetical protein